MLVRAITNRLQARQIRSNVSDAWFLSDKNHFVFTFSGTDKSGLLQQVSDLSNELECILKNGFTPEELDDAIKELSRTLKVDCSAKLHCQSTGSFQAIGASPPPTVYSGRRI